MRKRTIAHIADTLFWYLLYALPLLMYLINAVRHDTVPFVTFMTDNLGFMFSATNPFLTALNEIFGSAGILPLFTSDAALYLACWFISMLIVHLLVDFVVFIPRLAHKWLNKATQGD